MHTSVGCDNRSKDKLNPDTKRFGKGLQITFGGRKSDSWRRNCLRHELGNAVGITSEFETEIGSRYRVAMANGSALWRREDQVHDVLSNSEKERHQEMVSVMDGPEWPRIRLEMAVPVLIWSAVVGPFHSVISGSPSYSQIKMEFEVSLRKVGLILRSKSPFGKALKLAQESSHGPESTTPDALRLIDGQWRLGYLTDETIAEVNRVTKKAFDEVFQKMTKDWDLIRSLPIPNEKVVPWTNRRIESAFAYLKWVDQKYNTMTDSNIHMISMSKMNHLVSWIQSNNGSISTTSATESYYDLRRKREAEFTLEAAIENFSALSSN